MYRTYLSPKYLSKCTHFILIWCGSAIFSFKNVSSVVMVFKIDEASNDDASQKEDLDLWFSSTFVFMKLKLTPEF